MSLFKEGYTYNAHNLSVSALRGQKVNAPVLLSANKRSMFETVSISRNVLDAVYTPRKVSKLVTTLVRLFIFLQYLCLKSVLTTRVRCSTAPVSTTYMNSR